MLGVDGDDCQNIKKKPKQTRERKPLLINNPAHKPLAVVQARGVAEPIANNDAKKER